jgi:hypothetical protein
MLEHAKYFIKTGLGIKRNHTHTQSKPAFTAPAKVVVDPPPCGDSTAVSTFTSNPNHPTVQCYTIRQMDRHHLHNSHDRVYRLQQSPVE